MEFKEQSTDLAVTSSYDVTGAGASDVDVNQPPIQPDNTMSPFVSPEGAVVGQPQSTGIQVTSDPPASVPVGPHMQMPVGSPPGSLASAPSNQPNETINQPYTPFPLPPSLPVGEQVQPSGEAITDGAQVCPGGQPAEQQQQQLHPSQLQSAAADEQVATLSQSLERNVVIDGQPADQQPPALQHDAHSTPDAAPATQLQQPTGRLITTQQQLPAMSEAPVIHPSTCDNHETIIYLPPSLSPPSLSLSPLSLRFIDHFPGGYGLASTRMSPFCILLELRMMEVVEL